MNMYVAIYVRVSKNDLHPENQERQLVEYAQKQNWQFEVFREIESTRKTRPVKQEVLQKLRNREFNGVLIWKLDRWARSLQEILSNVTEFMSKKIDFIVLTQPIDTTSPSGMLMLQILGAFAEFEREIIRERTLSGLARARAQGKTLGRPRNKPRNPEDDYPAKIGKV
jgi:DNA invertase Pin-like site-specific DNA recombinase